MLHAYDYPLLPAKKSGRGRVTADKRQARHMSKYLEVG